MTYVPSQSLTTWLEGSRVGLWIERMRDGAPALVCKMPEVAIRALHQGAGCSLLMGLVRVRQRRIVCRGLRVKDDPDHPLSICSPSLLPADFELLGEILREGSTRLHCLNELNHPMLSATCSFELGASQQAQHELLRADPFLLPSDREGDFDVSDLDSLLRQALDGFQSLIYDGARGAEADMVFLTALQMVIALDEPIELIEISPTAQGGPFRVDDRDEGTKLEKAAYLVLDTIYPGKTYHSPNARIANGTREIADALALGDRFAFVVQAKALSVLGASSARSSERRTVKLRKDVAEAIKQLRGSMRRMRSGTELLDAEGTPIVWSERGTMPAHAIVLLSEMYSFLDWRAIARDTAKASESATHKGFFHVMDLMELSFAAQHAGSADAFESIMLQRWVTVQERGTAYLRAVAPRA